MQGQLLIAHPMLDDGYFKRTVIYLTEHDDARGSTGLVLNLKSDFFLRDFFPQMKHGNIPIYKGGPLNKNQLFYLHRLGHNLSESIAVGNDLFWGGNFQELCHMIEHGKVKSHEVRFFIGHSGWAPNQLKEELIQKAWFVAPVQATDLLRADPKTLWGEELGKIKSSYKVFSDIGYDPNLN